MTTNDMFWQREPTLTSKHLKSVLIQHKGRVHIIGGSGKFSGDRWVITRKKNKIIQSLTYSAKTRQTVLNGWIKMRMRMKTALSVTGSTENHIQSLLNNLPSFQLRVIFIYSVTEINFNQHKRMVYLGGLSYDEEYNPIVDDAAEYNTKLVYKNQNPSEFYSWVRHGELLRPRGAHKSVLMDDQVFHCAGYAKGKSIN